MVIRLAGLLLALPITANAMCFAPTPPSPPFTPPSEPFCMAKFRHLQKLECMPQERQAYAAAMKDYRVALDEYARQAAGFAYHAGEYAKCEADEAAKAQALAVERPSWLRHN